MKGTDTTRDYRRAGATSLGVLGLVLTPAACLVAALLLAHSVLVVPWWHGLNRIGVGGPESRANPIWLAPADDPTTPPAPKVAEETVALFDGNVVAPPSLLADGHPTNAARLPRRGESTERPGNERTPPGKGDEPPALYPADDVIVARLDSSAPTGAIHLESYGASGTTVMALSLDSFHPPETCASGRPVVVPIRSSDEVVATVTPEVLSFDCTGSELVTVTPAASGVATIRAGRPTTTPGDTRVVRSGASLRVEVTEAPPPNTEPTVRVPRPVTIEAAGRHGQTFAWRAVGFDAEDGELPATCTPTPGSIFLIGTTVVTCAVTDSRGFTDLATFDVTVVDGPVEDPDPGDGGRDVADVDKPYAPSVVLPPAAAIDDRGQWFQDRVVVKVMDNGDRIPLEGAPSGVDPRSFPGVILVNQAGRHTISGITVRDHAGNVSNPAPSISFNIDRVAPIVELICPSDPVEVGEARSANWIARDEGSGLATEEAGRLELKTDRPGTFTATVRRGDAVDEVGHVSEAAQCRYKVVEAKRDGETATPGEPVVEATAQPEADASMASDEVEGSPSVDPFLHEPVPEPEAPLNPSLGMSRTSQPLVAAATAGRRPEGSPDPSNRPVVSRDVVQHVADRDRAVLVDSLVTQA